MHDERYALVDKKGASVILKVSPRTVTRWHQAGLMPAPIVQDAHKTYWNRQHVIEWAQEKKTDQGKRTPWSA